MVEAHAPDNPLHRAEKIDRHRHGGSDHVFEQQSGPSAGQHPVGDGCKLEIRIHRCRDPPELSPLLQQLNEGTQVPCAGTGAEQRHLEATSSGVISVL